VPISKAIECSTALPVVYKPVDLRGRQLVDGGIRSTTNVDIAVEKGAKFIIVVNPLVPYVNDFEQTIPTVFGTRVRRVADMGLPAIANQAFRLIAHARLHEAVAQWEENYKGVDIILVEPEPNDELMFGTPIMDYSRRLQIARHGFESVTATLAQDYERYKEIAERHGLEISERRVRRAVERGEEAQPA
jgi:predicted acylesterase/phospholipase RssA